MSKRFFSFWLVGVLTFCSALYAHPEDGVPPESEFKVEKNVLDQIYDSAVGEAHQANQGALGMGIGVSFLSPKEFVLSNSYYDVTWAGVDRYFPMPWVSLGASFADWGWGGLSWSTRVGYTYREGLQTLSLKQGGASSRDFLRMHWASGTGRLEASVYLSWVKPLIYAGGGGQWIFQVGRIDGVNQSYLIPTITYGAELVLFDQSHKKGGSFSGVRLGIGQVSSISNSQKLSSLALDCGAAFVF